MKLSERIAKDFIRIEEGSLLSGYVSYAKKLESDNMELRRLLAFSQAEVFMYTDDGELQDNRCMPCIDFKRDSVGLIKQKLIDRQPNNLKTSN